LGKILSSFFGNNPQIGNALKRAGPGIKGALPHRPQLPPKLGRSLPEKSAGTFQNIVFVMKGEKLFEMTGVMY
jgi:hypothetical protein